MNKQDIKRVVLGQLASYLRTAVIIDGITEADLVRADEVQHELAREFDRRSKGAEYSAKWD